MQATIKVVFTYDDLVEMAIHQILKNKPIRGEDIDSKKTNIQCIAQDKVLLTLELVLKPGVNGF